MACRGVWLLLSVLLVAVSCAAALADVEAELSELSDATNAVELIQENQKMGQGTQVCQDAQNLCRILCFPPSGAPLF